MEAETTTKLPIGFAPFDAADYINTPEDVRASLDAAFEDGDPSVIA